MRVPDNRPGPPIFFIAPDPDLVDDRLVEDAYLQGSEAFVVHGATAGDLRGRLADLAEALPSALFVFWVDGRGVWESQLSTLNWLTRSLPASTALGLVYRPPAQLDAHRRLLEAAQGENPFLAGFVPLDGPADAHRRRILAMLAFWSVGGAGPGPILSVRPGTAAAFPREVPGLQGILVEASAYRFVVRFEGEGPAWLPGRVVRGVVLSLGGEVWTTAAQVAGRYPPAGEGTELLFRVGAGDEEAADLFVQRRALCRLLYRHRRAALFHEFEERVRQRAFFRASGSGFPPTEGPEPCP